MRSRLAVSPAPVGFVWAADLDGAKVRARARLWNVDAGRIRPLERQPRRLVERGRACEERRRHGVPAGADGHAHAPIGVGAVARGAALAVQLKALHDLADRRRIRVVVRGLRRHQRHGRQREQREALAVDGDLERLLLGVERHALVQIARELGSDLVLGIGREVVIDSHAAARAERQTGQALLLRTVVGHAEPVDVDERRRRADGEPADLVGCGEIALEQRRRELQHARDVVEAVARLVGRQELGDLDVEVQQIADGVAVLGAVQAVERLRAAGVRTRGGCRIELAFEPARELDTRFGGRPRLADGRHHAGAQLPDDFLPLGGMRGNGVERQRLEGKLGRALDVVVAARAIALDGFLVLGDQLLARRRAAGREYGGAGQEQDCVGPWEHRSIIVR